MDPLVPGGALGGGGAAAALSTSTARDALMDKLKTGEWTYPETMTVSSGKVNASVVFDIVFLAGFFLVWLWSLMPSSTKEGVKTRIGMSKQPVDKTTSRPEYEKLAIMNYCLKGNFNGANNTGLFRYVGFFTMEEVTNWLSVSFVCTIIAIKIISGAASVNPASIILVVIVGVVARHMRLGVKGADDGRPWRQLPPFLLLVSLLFALWAYTDAWRSRVIDSGSEDNGKNTMYVGAGVIFGFAAIAKTYISTGNMAEVTDEELEAKARALYDGEFAFYLTGFSTVVVGSAITFFVVSEAIFVAYAATKYYAIPFWFLQVIPFYFLFTTIGMTMNMNRGYKATWGAVAFNIFLTLWGSATLLFAQGHVCSFPGPDGKHVVEGCGALENMGFKELADDGVALEMQRWTVELLGAFAVMFHIALYVGARFSRYGLMRTIDIVCAKAEGDAGTYSVSDSKV